jgi:hypothetical protein
MKTLFINIRTLSFACVMVAMLGVGIMTPAQTAQAEELTDVERTVMIEQINMLMTLITQLMAQLQLTQTTSAPVSTTSLEESSETSGRIDIDVDVANSSYTSGDLVSFTYEIEGAPEGATIGIELQNNAAGDDYTLVSPKVYKLDGTTRALDLSEPQSSFPTNGTITWRASIYEGLLPIDGPLVLRVYDAEGEEVGRTRSQLEIISSTSVEEEDDTEDIGREAIDDLRKQIEEKLVWYAELEDVSREDEVIQQIEQLAVIVNAAEAAYQSEDSDEVLELVAEGKIAVDQLGDLLQEIEDDQSNTATPPEKNYLACDRYETMFLGTEALLSSGSLACYGMWDYGNSFGGDVDMCGSYAAGKTRCEIQMAVCISGSASAVNYYSNSNLNELSSEKLITIADNLSTTVEIVKEEVAGMWEYTCK